MSDRLIDLHIHSNASDGTSTADEVLQRAQRAGVAALLGQAAVEGAYFNVLINLPSLKDESFRTEVTAQANEIMNKATQLSNLILKTVREKLGCPTAS